MMLKMNLTFAFFVAVEFLILIRKKRFKWLRQTRHQKPCVDVAMSCLGRQNVPFNVPASQTVSACQPPPPLEAIAVHSMNNIVFTLKHLEWGGPSLTSGYELSVHFVLNVALRSVFHLEYLRIDFTNRPTPSF